MPVVSSWTIQGPPSGLTPFTRVKRMPVSTGIVDLTGLGWTPLVMILKQDGSVWRWGEAERPTRVQGFPQMAPIVAIAGNPDGMHGLAIDRSGNVWQTDSNLSIPVQVNRGFMARRSESGTAMPPGTVAAGESFTAVVAADGTVRVADRLNQSFSVLRGLRGHAVKMISAGRYHLLVLTTDGRVYGAGSNSHGCLGWRSDQRYEDGEPVAFAPERMNEAVEILGPTRIHRIIAGPYHNFAQSPDGWWGWGLHQVFSGSTMMLGGFGPTNALPDGSTYQFLYNRCLWPTLLPHLDDMHDVWPTQNHTFAARARGTFTIWNQYLGQSATLPVPGRVTKMFASYGPNVVLLDDGSVHFLGRPGDMDWEKTAFGHSIIVKDCTRYFVP